MTNLVIIKDNQAMTTSRMVAIAFEKEHKNVMRDILRLECSADFTRLNFEPSLYISELPNNGSKQLSEYNITRDGFTFLAMGYTGKRAAQFKEEYIKAFNEMEASLKAPVLLENKYTIEDLIIAQANSIKELKSEVLAMQIAMTEKMEIPETLQIESGQQNLFPDEKLMSISEYSKGKGFTNATLSYLGRTATKVCSEEKLNFKKQPNGNLYPVYAIEEAINKGILGKHIYKVPEIKIGESVEVQKIIELLKKNPLAQELKTIPIGKHKSYRGNLASILKNLIYQKIHKCSDLRFTISVLAKSKGWVKVSRIN